MKTTSRRSVLLFVLLLIILVTSACSSKLLVPFSTWIQVSFEAGDMINPNPEGRPSPVVVRLYELRNPTSFQTKDFFAIYDDDAAALGDAMVGRKEFNFRPSETAFVEKEVSEEVEYLGVFGAFRDIEESEWRAVIKLNKRKKNPLKVVINKQQITIKEQTK